MWTLLAGTSEWFFPNSRASRPIARAARRRLEDATLERDRREGGLLMAFDRLSCDADGSRARMEASSTPARTP